MKIQFKPFRIYIEKYHVQDGNIYPPRVLNLKRIGFILLAIIAFVAAICVFTHRNDNNEPAAKANTVEHQPLLPNSIADTLFTNINGIRVIPADSVDGRPTFDVVLEDEKVLESMYAEEIAYSLIHNKWIYNEDLSLDSLTTIKH